MPQTIYKWAIVSDVIIGYCGSGVLADVPWKQFVGDLNSKAIRYYLSTIGGTIDSTSLQRKMAVEVLNRRKIRVAVVVDDKVVKGVVTAASWLGADIKAFSWDDLRDAIAHLNSAGPFEDRIVETVEQLRLSK